MNNVKIGCFLYSIIEKEIIVINDKCNYLGHIDYDNLEIQIKEGQKNKKQILLHEIIHGIAQYFELSINENEKIIDCLSKGIYSFLKDNKEFIDWIISDNV